MSPHALTVPPPRAGITRFDLLGDFGRFNWLGNFYIVFLYNMGFAALTTLCLVKRVSWAVQAELIRAFGEGGARGWGGSRVLSPPRRLLPSPSAQVCTSCLCLCHAPGTSPSPASAGDRDVPPSVTARSQWCFRDIGAPPGELRLCGGELPVSSCAAEPWP